MMNEAAWKGVFRAQWDEPSGVDWGDHMSAGYRDILPGPRLCVSEKFYPVSWWSSFFSPCATDLQPLYRPREFMRGWCQSRSYRRVFYCLPAKKNLDFFLMCVTAIVVPHHNSILKRRGKKEKTCSPLNNSNYPLIPNILSPTDN